MKHPEGGGSYIRQKNGSLKKVEGTEPADTSAGEMDTGRDCGPAGQAAAAERSPKGRSRERDDLKGNDNG